MKNSTLITHLLAVALGVVLTLWLHPSSDHQQTEFEKEIQERDLIISRLQKTRANLSEKVDSLQNVRNQIEYRYDTLEIEHQDRYRLPFAISDTAARYSFFAERFPDLFTHQSH